MQPGMPRFSGGETTGRPNIDIRCLADILSLSDDSFVKCGSEKTATLVLSLYLYLTALPELGLDSSSTAEKKRFLT